MSLLRRYGNAWVRPVILVTCSAPRTMGSMGSEAALARPWESIMRVL